jgi:NAD+ kinase
MARRMIRAVGIHPNFSKRRCRVVFDELVAWLQREGCTVWVSEALGAELPALVQTVPPETLADRVDLLVVLGGDGTLLAAARMLYPREVPILGVNFGGLGFLTGTSVPDLYAALEQVLRGDYVIERRMMLQASILGRDGSARAVIHALNDAVIHEAGQRLVRVRMTIGGTQVGDFGADGLVVATPTGSTAYSLSAGGPILNPLLDALIVTPICAHKLSVRPVIFPAFESILLEPQADRGEVFLSVDGQQLFPLARGDSVLVARAEHNCCFVQLRARSFYDVLREKLKWGT